MEIGNAARALENELPARFVKTTNTDVLVQTAKKLERLQARRRALNRELKRINQDIRLEKRHLRALCSEIGQGK